MAENAKRKDWIMCIWSGERDIESELGHCSRCAYSEGQTGTYRCRIIFLFLLSRYVMLFAPFLMNTCPANVGMFVNACLIIISICLFQFVSLVPWCSLMALFLHVFCDLPVFLIFDDPHLSRQQCARSKTGHSLLWEIWRQGRSVKASQLPWMSPTSQVGWGTWCLVNQMNKPQFGADLL